MMYSFPGPLVTVHEILFAFAQGKKTCLVFPVLKMNYYYFFERGEVHLRPAKILASGSRSQRRNLF